MLVPIQRKFVVETEKLASSFLSSVGSHIDTSCSTTNLTAEMATVRLYDAWTRFCRNLIIASAGAAPQTTRGMQLTCVHGVTNISDVIPVLLSKYPNRRRDVLRLFRTEIDIPNEPRRILIKKEGITR